MIKLVSLSFYLYRSKHSDKQKLEDFLKNNKSSLFWSWYKDVFKENHQTSNDKVLISLSFYWYGWKCSNIQKLDDPYLLSNYYFPYE